MGFLCCFIFLTFLSRIGCGGGKSPFLLKGDRRTGSFYKLELLQAECIAAISSRGSCWLVSIKKLEATLRGGRNKILGKWKCQRFPHFEWGKLTGVVSSSWPPCMWICTANHRVHLCHQACLLEHVEVIFPHGIVVLFSAGNIQRSWPKPQRQGVAGGSPGQRRGGAAKQWRRALMARTSSCGGDSDWGWDEAALRVAMGCGVWGPSRNWRRDPGLCYDGDGSRRARWWL